MARGKSLAKGINVEP